MRLHAGLLACSLVLAACSDDDADPIDGRSDGGRPDASSAEPDASSMKPDASSMKPDAGGGAAGRGPDAGGGRADASADAGADSRCTKIDVAEFQLSLEDDVSVRYGADVTPRIANTFSLLELLFERYSPEPDIGTFELGGYGPDGNFGRCAHCVAIPGIAPVYAYFADRGTLVVEANSYMR